MSDGPFCDICKTVTTRFWRQQELKNSPEFIPHYGSVTRDKGDPIDICWNCLEKAGLFKKPEGGKP